MIYKINKILDKVNKPARYIGGEANSAYKENMPINMALAFPDLYEIGESNLGLKILYDILNKENDTFCQRIYAPDTDMKEIMEKENIPLWTLETKTPINKLDIIGFSLAYELCYTTMLSMLNMGNIPVYSKDRTNEPIIVAGGHCVCNPAPIADFIDAFCIGDGEEVIINIKNAVLKDKGNRKKILKNLSEIPGVYVPSIHKNEIIQAQKVKDFDKSNFPLKPIIPHIGVVHDRIMLEIMRGCTRGCRFCQAGMITRPVRERNKSTLLKQAEALIKNTGYEEISLTSLSSTDYSQIKPLIDDLTNAYIDKKVGISLPSIRADVDCVAMAHSISKIRKSGLTFAPEAGSQRMRDVINKNLTENDLINSVSSAIDCGWKRVKLYFMIGLPYETNDDILDIAHLIHKVMRISKERKAGLTLSVTISPFVPKPHTPFQWRQMDTQEKLEEKITLLRDNIKNKSVLLSWHNPATSSLEAALARGDRNLGKAIYNAYKLGAYLEQDRYLPEIWLKASQNASIDLNSYTYRSYNHKDNLPWDNIDVGVSKKYLINEDLKAQKAITTPSCKYSDCAGCGMKGLFKNCPPENGKNDDYIINTEPIAKTENTGTAVFRFSKKNMLRFIGHLDLMAIFEKAVRISNVPVWYSEGFNPHPKISIPQPLPLGAECESDIFTMRIYYPCDKEKILNDLNNALPKDIRLKTVEIIETEKRIVQPKKSLYSLKVNKPENLEEIKNKILSKNEIIIERKKSKTEFQKLDLKDLIEKLYIKDNIIYALLPHKTHTAKPIEIFNLFKTEIKDLELLMITRKDIIY